MMKYKIAIGSREDQLEWLGACSTFIASVQSCNFLLEEVK